MTELVILRHPETRVAVEQYDDERAQAYRDQGYVDETEFTRYVWSRMAHNAVEHITHDRENYAPQCKAPVPRAMTFALGPSGSAKVCARCQAIENRRLGKPVPTATKDLTATQKHILRNIRDYGFHAATGFHGMSQRGGAVKSVDALRARGLVDGPHRSEHLTDEGKRVLQEIEDARTLERNTGMTNRVRDALRVAGLTEARGNSLWGYRALPGTIPGMVHLSYVRGPDFTKKESSVRFGNDQISQYVRVLQNVGYRVSRVNGVTKVDNLMVMIANSNKGEGTK